MYLLLLFFALFIIIQSGFFTKKSNRKSVVGVIFVVLVVLIGTFRDTTIGTDIGLYGGYNSYWRDPAGYERDLEPGFRWFTLLIKSISNSYYFYYSLIFILNIIFYYLACKRMKIGFSLFLAILFCASMLTPSFNVIRQMLGLSIGLYLFSLFYYEQKSVRNIVIYEISVFLCGILIHTSIVLLCLIPLFDIPALSKLFSKNWFLIFLAAISVFLSKYGVSLISQYVLRFTGVFGARADAFIDVVDTFDVERTRGFVTDVINFTIIIYLSKDNRNDLFKIGFLGYCLSCISAATLGFIGRAFDNLVVFTCLYYAQNWSQFVSMSRTKVLTSGAMVLRIIFWMTAIYYTVLQNESINPYHSYLF